MVAYLRSVKRNADVESQLPVGGRVVVGAASSVADKERGGQIYSSVSDGEMTG